MPSLVARDAFLLAVAIPFIRRIVSALARSPLASSKARLQSIMPAFVFSRSCLTTFGSISVLTLIDLKFDAGNRLLRRHASHLDLFANPRFAAGRHNGVDQLLQNNANRTNRVVISRNRVIDLFRIRI